MIKRGVAAVALLLTGCGIRRDSVLALDFPREVTVYVAVSPQVAKHDTGNVAAMVDALEADLKADERFVTIVAARLDEAPPLPRLEIQVRDSTSGDAGLRGAGQLAGLLSPLSPLAGVALTGAGSGSMEVDAYIVESNNHSKKLGHFSGSSLGAMSEQSVAAGERVGHHIAHCLEI